MLIKNNKFEILTPEGWCDFDGVFVSNKKAYRAIFNDRSSIIVSDNHKFKIKENWFNIFEIFHNDLELNNKTIEEIEELKNQYLYDPVNVKNKDHSYFSDDLISHNCLWDEAAFVSPRIADQFYTAIYPTLSTRKNSKIAIISTPNGMNFFYNLFKKAEKGESEYKYIDIKWNEIPGRDENFKIQTIKNIGEDRWMQEYEAEFLGGENTLIAPRFLQDLSTVPPIKTLYGNKLKFFYEPKKDKNYFITVDVSRGKGLDNSAFVVFDISEYPVKIVAHYSDPDISPLLFPGIINNIGKMYNNADILVEVNDIGQQIADILFDEYEYPNLLGCIVKGRMGQQLQPFMSKAKGIKTSKVTKRVGCNLLKTMIELNKLEINSFDIVYELSNFAVSGDSYSATDGEHDDLVMCLVIFAWALQQPYMKNYLEYGVRETYEINIRELEDELIPAGFHSDEDFDWKGF